MNTKQQKIVVIIIIFFLFFGIAYMVFVNKNRFKEGQKKELVQEIPTPTPTPILYKLPDPDFSGLRQTLTPNGEIREIVGKVISYDKKTNKIKIGDEAIPFIYNLNISTSEAFIVDEVSVNEKGIVVYSKSDESKIIFGIKIIADCPEEKIDPGCQVISKVHILKGEISKKILVPKFVLPTK